MIWATEGGGENDGEIGGGRREKWRWRREGGDGHRNRQRIALRAARCVVHRLALPGTHVTARFLVAPAATPPAARSTAHRCRYLAPACAAPDTTRLPDCALLL